MIDIVGLGCGPSGLLAVHGAIMAAAELDFDGLDVHIVSTKRKSPMAGAQFVHKAIPGLSLQEGAVRIGKVGTRQDYAYKVYGNPMHECSWDNYPEGWRPCWSMKEVYEELWGRYGNWVQDQVVGPKVLDEIEQTGADMLISSIPAPVLCDSGNHAFLSSEVKIVVCPSPASENFIIYDGNREHHYYRQSNMYGQAAFEYGQVGSPPAKMSAEMRLVRVMKPQGHNCDCRPLWRRVG